MTGQVGPPKGVGAGAADARNVGKIGDIFCVAREIMGLRDNTYVLYRYTMVPLRLGAQAQVEGEAGSSDQSEALRSNPGCFRRGAIFPPGRF